MPSEYESPPQPLIKKTCFGDSAPNNQASARRSRASTATSSVVMQSRDVAPTEGGLPEDYRRILTSSIVLTRKGSLTKRQAGSGVDCTALRSGELRQDEQAQDRAGGACRLRHGVRLPEVN